MEREKKSCGAKTKKTKSNDKHVQGERLVTYRLRDRDVSDLLIIQRSLRNTNDAINRILLRLAQGEHPSTDEELAKDESGYWGVRTFIEEWQLNEKKVFEYRGGKPRPLPQKIQDSLRRISQNPILKKRDNNE